MRGIIMIIKGYLFSILYAGLCVLVAAFAGRLGVPKKYTRKLVHILVGFEWVILSYYMRDNLVHFFVVCLICLALLFVDYKCKLVAAISSEGDNAPGTVYYAVAMSLMAAIMLFLPDMLLPFGVGVFCTSFGDGLAAVVGQSVKRHNPRIWREKTLFGTLTSLLVCVAVPLAFSALYDEMDLSVWHCVLIGVFAFEIELFAGRGLDNIAITFGASLLTYAMMYHPVVLDYILPIILTPLIIAFAYGKRALTLGGIFAALALDLAVSISLRNFGFAVLLTFFVGSVIVDKVKKHYKKAKNKSEIDREKRGDCRDVVQVLANGLISGAAAVMFFITDNRLFLFAFVASLAEAFADSAASGVGFFARRAYDPFRLERCEKGVSGGMSILGTSASLVAAFVVSSVALAFGEISLIEMLIIAAAAFLGAVFDSFLGSLFQVKYKCRVCQHIVERTEHCGEITEKYRGFVPISNDVVNFISTLFAATLAAIVSIAI